MDSVQFSRAACKLDLGVAVVLVKGKGVNTVASPCLLLQELPGLFHAPWAQAGPPSQREAFIQLLLAMGSDSTSCRKQEERNEQRNEEACHDLLSFLRWKSKVTNAIMKIAAPHSNKVSTCCQVGGLNPKPWASMQ